MFQLPWAKSKTKLHFSTPPLPRPKPTPNLDRLFRRQQVELWGKLNSSQKFSALLILFLILTLPISLYLSFHQTRTTPRATFPITAPIQMMLRLGVSDIPVWQIVTSIGVLGLSIFVGLSFSVKIFRTFMLMYGKRPRLAEIRRSLKTA